MSLTHAVFALAGLIAALGPVLIHIWNRNRYRTIHWGAMDFLSQAWRQSRQRMQLRDLLVLILRMLAVAFAGLALAQPIVRGGQSPILVILLVLLILGAIAAGFATLLLTRTPRGRLGGIAALTLALGGLAAVWQTDWITRGIAGAGSARRPLHAIIILDNSQSMAATLGQGNLLEIARREADSFIADLPTGSQVSLLPLCGFDGSIAENFHTHADEARAALTRIEQADQAGTSEQMLELVSAAGSIETGHDEKLALFFTDLQANAWPEELPVPTVPEVPLRIIELGGSSDPAHLNNVSIDAFSLRDGMVEPDLPATFLAQITNRGQTPVRELEIELWWDGARRLTDIAELQPGETRSWQWSLPIESFSDAAQTSVRPAWVSVRTTEAATDRLLRDNTRYLAAPVVRQLPILLVDAFGADENRDAGRTGETRQLRRLLNPRPRDGVYDSFVECRQATLPQLTPEMLAEVRVVVVAGVESPAPESVALLRQYVEQGGQLLVAAGGLFDPQQWNDIAWRDGLGILPAPLAPTPIGIRPSLATSTDEVTPHQIDLTALRDPLFQIAGASDSALADLWRQAFFFQAVDVQLNDAVEQTLLRTEIERLTRVREQEQAPPTPRPSTEEIARRHLTRLRAQLAPTTSDESPRPLLVERRLGEGSLLFFSSGISSDWTTLGQSNAVIFWDRLTRELIARTLPNWTREAGQPLSWQGIFSPDGAPQGSPSEWLLTPPAGSPLTLTIPPSPNVQTDPSQPLTGPLPQSGIYTLTSATSPNETNNSSPISIAVNAPPRESDLRRLDPARYQAWTRLVPWEVLPAGQPILWEAGTQSGQRLGRTFAALALVCLALEMLIVAFWGRGMNWLHQREPA